MVKNNKERSKNNEFGSPTVKMLGKNGEMQRKSKF